MLQDVDWRAVAERLDGDGWIRLRQAIDGRSCTRLLAAAPTTWTALAHSRTVRQSGFHCGAFVEHAGTEVNALAASIQDGIDGCGSLPPLPAFNEAEWSRMGYITAHRDPPGVGGVIAIVTLSGNAPFRAWPGDADPRVDDGAPDPVEWETEDGDLVLVRGAGWPRPDLRCPVHEVEPPRDRRAVLTLRHNAGGPGADYWAGR